MIDFSDSVYSFELRGSKFLIDVRYDTAYSDITGSTIPSFWRHAATGEWEPETFLAIDKFCERETTFIDLGAWVGIFSLYAAARGCQVYCFEPDPVAYQKLKLNLNANPALPITHSPNAVTRDGQSVSLYASRPGDSETSIYSIRQRGLHTVHADFYCTVASEAFKNVLRRIECSNQKTNSGIFVKIDIEGGEYSLLDGMRATDLKPVKCILLSLHPENIISPQADLTDTFALRQEKALCLFPLLATCSVYRYRSGDWFEYPMNQIRDDVESSGSLSQQVLCIL